MKPLKFENATILEKDGNLIISEEIEGNVVERSLLDELKIYVGAKGINLKLSKARAVGGGRKKQAKYVCGCNNKITSSDEKLGIRCLKCGQEFKILE